MVISRPGGTDDVGYRMLARPLLEQVREARGTVELVVLRPPTLDALGDALVQAGDAGNAFHIVHFDGHGVLSRTPGTSARSPADPHDGEGILMFERPGGGADPVPAARLALILRAADVPIVVLNACQSGAVGKALESAVATRLLQEGVSAVVGMAYSVYAVAAAQFMAAFYERLFAGGTTGEAVSAGRLRMFIGDKRPSAKGDMSLSDWVVPVHYLRRNVHFPQLRQAGSANHLVKVASHKRHLSSTTSPPDSEIAAAGPFVGRDGLFYDIELACRAQCAVLLYGSAGSGKTALAKAFGRWWAETGGVDMPQDVLFHSFQPGSASCALDNVLDGLGLQLVGEDFARVGVAERESVILGIARARRLLLIWDNFESVHTMPDPTSATPPLDACERGRLRAFVLALASAGRSPLLITSRTPEGWLGDKIARMMVGGLTSGDAAEFVDALLPRSPAVVARRARPAFRELLETLSGHPLAMQLVLPHVASTDPEAVLDALRGHRETSGVVDDLRLGSLEDCVRYSFQHLKPDTQRLLVAVSLFHGVVDATILELLSGAECAPSRFAGLDRYAWAGVLESAAEVGLLTGMGSGIYSVHPALPAYLAALWRTQERDSYAQEHDRASHALLTGYATFGGWLDWQIRTGDARLALRLVDLQRRSIGHCLARALAEELWSEAREIAEPLAVYCMSRGLYGEARGWFDRARAATEGRHGTTPDLATPAGGLWRYVVTSQADVEYRGGNVVAAERIYRQLYVSISAYPSSSWQGFGLATILQRLGILEQDRGCYDEAETLYQRALAMSDQSGEQSSVRASVYHQLGVLAQERGRLDDARGLHQQALEIEAGLGDGAEMASSYHQLGVVSELAARPEEAARWYRQSLKLSEPLGILLLQAATYHQLGTLAFRRRRLDEAEVFLRRSLVITERLGNVHDLAGGYLMSGLLAEVRGQNATALEWLVMCLTLFDEFPHPATLPAPDQLRRLVGRTGIRALEACWHAVTGERLPSAVREYVVSSPDDGRHQ